MKIVMGDTEFETVVSTDCVGAMLPVRQVRGKHMEQPKITVKQDGDKTVISDDTTFNFGEGPDFIEALRDFCESTLKWLALSENN